MAKNFNKKETFSAKSNDEIKYDIARVIYKEHKDTVSENDFNKVMKVYTAKKIACEKGLDLIEINPNTTPPILKIYDYSRYIWELKQKAKQNKGNTIKVKEVQLSVNISKHDMETKAKRAIEFLSKGDKVKTVLTMRGRELGRREESSKSLYEFLNMVGDMALYESMPKDEGNKIVVILKPKK